MGKDSRHTKKTSFLPFSFRVMSIVVVSLIYNGNTSQTAHPPCCEMYNNMLLLTNCEVRMENIWTTVLKYGPNEMRSVRKTEVRIFYVWKEQLVNKSFIV